MITTNHHLSSNEIMFSFTLKLNTHTHAHTHVFGFSEGENIQTSLSHILLHPCALWWAGGFWSNPLTLGTPSDKGYQASPCPEVKSEVRGQRSEREAYGRIGISFTLGRSCFISLSPKKKKNPPKTSFFPTGLFFAALHVRILWGKPDRQI